MPRKLARIEKILSLSPIPNADAIECATVGGWKVVVRKGEYHVGETVVFFEIDSFIPEFLAPFLTKKGGPKIQKSVPGNVLKTVRLRGQISQGLVMKVSDVSIACDVYIRGLPVGHDLTEELGIQKYEPPLNNPSLGGDAIGPFPSFLVKTDEERIQNFNYQELVDLPTSWSVTEKLDGSSMTVYLKDGEFGVCSRNINFRLDSESNFRNAYILMAKKLELEGRLQSYGRNIALQGEIIGLGIQKNRYGLKEQEFHIFTVFDIDSHKKVPPKEFLRVSSDLGLQTVPILEGELTELPPNLDTILEMSDGKSQLNLQKEREGLVFRANFGPEKSFKVISNNFLLKAGL